MAADTLSPYHVRRLTTLFAEKCRPEIERQSYECSICGFHGPFEPVYSAQAIRFDAQCPKCNSRERHRFLKHWMDTDPRGAAFGDVIHFAPEHAMIDLMRGRSSTYRTADIAPDVADLQLNIEAIDLPDGSVDVVMANHVLEHVDDRKALPEIWRILRPGGLAILTTPVIAEWESSYENPDLRGARIQFRHFGQEDHLRYFGRDLSDRIRAAGFALEQTVTNGANAAKYALLRGDTIYLATRPAN